MHQSRVFTMTGGGKPFFSFGATTHREAASLMKEQWLLDELLSLRFEDHPLWDGKAKLAVRDALADEEAVFWQTAKDADQESGDLVMAYLVKLDATDTLGAVEPGAVPRQRS